MIQVKLNEPSSHFWSKLAYFVSPPFVVIDLFEKDLSHGTEEGKDLWQSEGENQTPYPSNLQIIKWE